MGLVLRAADVAGPCRWRWLLLDERSEVLLADHLVRLSPGMAETEAFEDLYRFLRWRADPDHRVASEAELMHQVGAWIGSVVLGGRIIRAIATAAPVTVRVVLPAGAEFLAFRPLELAHIDGVPMAARGDVALVYDLPGPARVAKAPIREALRMLAVFSLPTAASAAGLRRERYELSRLVRRVAARGRRRVQLEIVQHGVTREVLGELAGTGKGWDVLHLSGHGAAGHFLLERADGAADPVSTTELIGLLRPLRPRVKLAVVSSCQPAVTTTAETLCWLGLDELAADLEAQAALDAATTPKELARALSTELGCAVVAMRYPVVNDFAVGFAGAFYDRVFRNVQRLDRAVAASVPDAAGPAPSSDLPAISVTTPALFGASAITLSVAPPVGRPVLDPADEAMAWFPPEPPRFIGRAEAMAAADTALARAAGVAAVLLHGMAGMGTTACAVELAYRHRRAFVASAFWSAPTDPEQLGDALRLLAVALEAQLGEYGFTGMADHTATPERLENFLPTLTAVLIDVRVLLVMDNLDTLLTADGQWRDLRWALLIGALTAHGGPSRAILTSRIVPAGLDLDTVLVRSVHALSRDESLLLARELPNLRTLLPTRPVQARSGASGIADPALCRRVLTVVQGHPTLLELADAAAADPARLAARLTAVESALDEVAPDQLALDQAALEAFLTEGDTRLDAGQFQRMLTAWTTDAVAALSVPARLLLQALCRIEETDRTTAVLRVNWATLWRNLDQSGEPPPLQWGIAPLCSAALITADPIDEAAPGGPVRYRIHQAVAEVIRAATPEQVTATVDRQLAGWWVAVGDWAIERQKAGGDTRQLEVRASLAAVRYLLRRQDWDAASCLLERTLFRDRYAVTTALAVIPALRCIAEATTALKDLVVLAAALRKVDPGEAEMLLRRAYEQANADGDHQLASTTAGDLVTLLRDQGRLREALTLAGQKIEHTGQAGFGRWTRLSDQGRRLQILDMLGHHEQVLAELPGLRVQLAELSGSRPQNDRVNPGHVQEGILDVGRCSATALARWEEALNLNDEIADLKRRQGANPYDTACTRFNNYVPLLRLGRLADVDQLLRDCQDVFDAVGDITQLAVVYQARADLEDKRDRPRDAADLQRASLRLRYVRPDPDELSAAHHNLANYLGRACDAPAEQRAHRLAAALLNHLAGDTRELTRTLGVLAGELHNEINGPEAPVLPTVLSEVTLLVESGDGVRFGNLIAALCPDSAVAEQALADLLATAATSVDQQPNHVLVNTDHFVAAWAPIMAAIGTAAADGDVPGELTELLEDIAVTDWAALTTALRRLLAGTRDRDELLVGLDEVGAAIVTATLDLLGTASGRE